MVEKAVSGIGRMDIKSLLEEKPKRFNSKEEIILALEKIQKDPDTNGSERQKALILLGVSSLCHDNNSLGHFKRCVGLDIHTPEYQEVFATLVKVGARYHLQKNEDLLWFFHALESCELETSEEAGKITLKDDENLPFFRAMTLAFVEEMPYQFLRNVDRFSFANKKMRDDFLRELFWACLMHHPTITMYALHTPSIKEILEKIPKRSRPLSELQFFRECEAFDPKELKAEFVRLLLSRGSEIPHFVSLMKKDGGVNALYNLMREEFSHREDFFAILRKNNEALCENRECGEFARQVLEKESFRNLLSAENLLMQELVYSRSFNLLEEKGLSEKEFFQAICLLPYRQEEAPSHPFSQSYDALDRFLHLPKKVKKELDKGSEKKRLFYEELVAFLSCLKRDLPISDGAISKIMAMVEGETSLDFVKHLIPTIKVRGAICKDAKEFDSFFKRQNSPEELFQDAMRSFARIFNIDEKWSTVILYDRIFQKWMGRWQKPLTLLRNNDPTNPAFQRWVRAFLELGDEGIENLTKWRYREGERQGFSEGLLLKWGRPWKRELSQLNFLSPHTKKGPSLRKGSVEESDDPEELFSFGNSFQIERASSGCHKLLILRDSNGTVVGSALVHLLKEKRGRYEEKEKNREERVFYYLEYPLLAASMRERRDREEKGELLQHLLLTAAYERALELGIPLLVPSKAYEELLQFGLLKSCEASAEIDFASYGVTPSLVEEVNMSY